MESSSNSNSTKLDLGLDLEAISPDKWRRKLVKYHTMGDHDEIKEIELSSEFSQFEESEQNDSENNERLPTPGIYSEGGFEKQKSFPKLMNTKIARQISSDLLRK